MYTFSLIQLAFLLAVVALIFFGAGVYWYRYTLKHDPARLARLAAEAKGFGNRVTEGTKEFLDRTKK